MFQNKLSVLQNSMERHSFIIGIIATIIGILAYLPVILTVKKTHNTANFPIETLCLAITANICWIVYGLSKNPMAKASIVMGTSYLCIYAYILSVKTKSNHSKKSGPEDLESSPHPTDREHND